MPTILLVRHAQASYGGPDYDVLSGLAGRQNQALRAEVARRGLREDRLAVVSGPARRQRESAAQVFPGVPVTVDDGWDEYSADDVIAQYGGPDSAGASLTAGERTLTSRAFQDVLDQALARWVAAPNGTYPGFTQRVGSAVERVVASLGRGETAVVFTSAGAIAAVAAKTIGTPAAFVALNRVQLNTGVTKLVVGASGVTLVSFNEHAHLEGEDRALLTYR